MEDSSSDSLKSLLNSSPFIISNQNISISENKISEIKKASSNFTKSLQNYVISEKKYDIDFIDNGETVTIKFNQASKCILKINNILKIPFEVNFEDINKIEINQMLIFRLNVYNKLIFYLSTNLDKYFYEEKPESKILTVSRKIFTIPDEIITESKKNNFNDLEHLVIQNIKINPLLLSSNFYQVFNDVIKEKDFYLIINEERIDFFKKIINFINSNKKFYYITGTDGIGKSISLLYFSLFTKYQFVYFNIKLYSLIKTDEEFREAFSNDLHKFFLFNYDEDNKDWINSEFSKSMIKIEETVKKNNKINIRKIFKYIIAFMNCFGGEKYIMIIDQYKSDESDPDFEGLNEIINFYYNSKQNVKFIISSSINNISNKLALLRNLSNIYLDSNSNDLSKLIYSQNLENINLYNNKNILPIEKEYTQNEDELENKFECDFCEKIFTEEKNKRMEKIKAIVEYNNNFMMNSKCLLDNQFMRDTKKDYFSNLVNGQDTFKDSLNEQEYILAENFNFNLKYINKYLKFKSKIEKNANETDEMFGARIISAFYEKISNKMEDNLKNFFESLYRKYYEDKFTNYLILEFQSLCKLRSFIFYEKKFNIKDLADELLIFPMKYLKILINDYDEYSFPLKKMDLNFSFKLEYNNNFIRIIINRLIDHIFKGINNVSINSFKGSGEGSFLELKVDENFRDNSKKIFGLIGYECRYLFSLVSKTNSSDETILKHRKSEAKLLFFGKKEYNILIDDIDQEILLKINSNHYNLDKKYYYFSQVSMTGKAFDMCIIEREQDNKFKLYLFQVSKNKLQELQTKYYYLLQADAVAKNLENLYQIDITNRYLIFVLPRMEDTIEFKKNLESHNYCYIFYDSSLQQFFNKSGEELNSLEFPNALLDTKLITQIIDSEKIKHNYFIWENSMKEFINKKRTVKKSFYQMYINNYYNFNKFNQVKLILPNQIQDLLLNNIIRQKDAILKFIGNCNLKNIDTFKHLYEMVIIIKNEDKIYIMYDILYLLKETGDKFNFQPLEEENFQKYDNSLDLIEQTLPTIQASPKKYKKIKFQDFLAKKKYNGKCFCYLVITTKKLKNFYNYWC